jgi:coiled-coil domain-containing protein 12
MEVVAEDDCPIKFRNYRPMDKTLFKYCVNPPKDYQKDDKESTTANNKRKLTQNMDGEMDIDEEIEETPQQTPTELAKANLQKKSINEKKKPASGLTSTQELLEKYSLSSSNIIAEELAKYQLDDSDDDMMGSGGIGSNPSYILPKKINWDLKKQLMPKLDKLKKRTQKAIVEMLREKFAKEDNDDENEEEGKKGNRKDQTS